MARIEATMNERHQRQEIFGIRLSDRPMYAWCMSGCIAEHAERAPDEVRKTALLTLLTFALERVDRQHGWGARECPVYERRAIVGKAGERSQLIGHTLDGLEHCVKVVVRQQLRATKL